MRRSLPASTWKVLGEKRQAPANPWSRIWAMKSEKAVSPFPMHVPGPAPAGGGLLKVVGSQSSRTFTSWGFELARALLVRASPRAIVRAPATAKRQSLGCVMLLLHFLRSTQTRIDRRSPGRRPRRVQATLHRLGNPGQETMRRVKRLPSDRSTRGDTPRGWPGLVGSWWPEPAPLIRPTV